MVAEEQGDGWNRIDRCTDTLQHHVYGFIRGIYDKNMVYLQAWFNTLSGETWGKRGERWSVEGWRKGETWRDKYIGRKPVKAGDSKGGGKTR